MTKPRIVVLGAGYAGLMTTRKLTQTLNVEEAEIVLVNKHNYHYETTWLHEVAAGTINPNQARVMLRDVIDPNRVRLIYDEVEKINKDDQQVVMKNSEISYDFLVISIGFETNTFGIKGMEKAFSITDIDSSRMIYDHIEYQFAKYNNEKNPKDDSLTILVGGCGFTGAEFIGELAEKVPKLCKKYDIDRSKARIINVEAAPSILPGFDKELVEYAKKSLEARGVEFRIGTKIQECKKNSFVVGEDEEEIKAGTIVWTGGVKGSSILEKTGFEITKGKVTVDSDMRAPGEEDIFILGDCAWVMNEAEGRPYPPTAQAATQHGETCANNLAALLRNEPLTGFEFDDKGTVASLGVNDGIGTVFNDMKLQGKPAATMKKVIDNRSLFLLGGTKLLLKKGKIRPF